MRLDVRLHGVSDRSRFSCQRREGSGALNGMAETSSGRARMVPHSIPEGDRLRR